MLIKTTRGATETGIWTLEELQQAVGRGEVLPTDHVQPEGFTNWLPLAEIAAGMGIKLPLPPPAAPPVPPTITAQSTPPPIPTGPAAPTPRHLQPPPIPPAPRPLTSPPQVSYGFPWLRVGVGVIGLSILAAIVVPAYRDYRGRAATKADSNASVAQGQAGGSDSEQQNNIATQNTSDFKIEVSQTGIDRFVESLEGKHIPLCGKNCEGNSIYIKDRNLNVCGSVANGLNECLQDPARLSGRLGRAVHIGDMFCQTATVGGADGVAFIHSICVSKKQYDRSVPSGEPFFILVEHHGKDNSALNKLVYFRFPSEGLSRSEQQIQQLPASIEQPAEDQAEILAAAAQSHGDAATSVIQPDSPALVQASSPPEYPPEERRRGIQGTTILIVSIDASGTLTDVQVEESSGNRNLDRAAVQAARQWRFNPEIKDGYPIASRLRTPVEFKLEGAELKVGAQTQELLQEQQSQPTPTATQDAGGYVQIEFIGRDPPSPFTFRAVSDDTNRVNGASAGIRFTGVNLPCGMYRLMVDKPQDAGGGVARDTDLCKASGFMILPGEIYTLRNRSNSDLVSKNVRGQ